MFRTVVPRRAATAAVTTAVPESERQLLLLARRALASGKPADALAHLDAVKRVAPLTESSDFLRAAAFVMQGDYFAARQSALEELRHHPANAEALAMAPSLRQKLRPFIELPADVVAAEPVFAMAHDALCDHTMLDVERLLALYRATREAVAAAPAGPGARPWAIVECGTAGGGSLAMMGIAAAHAVSEVNAANARKHQQRQPAASRCTAPLVTLQPRLIACDTFRGMPPPTSLDRLASQPDVGASASHWADGTCSGSEAQVRRLADAFSLDVTTVPGLFADTLPPLLARERDLDIRVLHIDCDWYESTRDALRLLWPRLAVGGRFQIDDFLYWDGCKEAVREFFSALPVPPKCSQAGVALCGTKVG